jgi:hypothetical protein
MSVHERPQTFSSRVPRAWAGVCASYFGVARAAPLHLSLDGYPVGSLRCVSSGGHYTVWAKWDHGVFALHAPRRPYPAPALGYVLLDRGRALQFFGAGGAAEPLACARFPHAHARGFAVDLGFAGII